MAYITTEFFIDMIPPTQTAQEKKIMIRNGKPVVYEPAELKAVRQNFVDHLAKHRPADPIDGPVELVVIWCFQANSPERDGKWKTTKPDTDNLQKMFKDCMTRTGFWKDDALVCREIIEKFWAVRPGIYVRVSELEE